MGAIAGRVLILPKGEYDATTAYEFLDLINYGGRSWIAKKSSVGIEPTDANAEYWQPFGSSIIPDGVTVEINENGEISVVDTPKLGGKDASEYATDEEIKSNSIWNELTEGFDLNNALGKYRTASSSIVRSLLNKPADLTTGEVTVEWFPSYNNNLYGMQIIKVTANKLCKTFIRARQDTWGEWDGYLPLSGGKLTSANAQILQFNRTGESARTLLIDFLVNNVRQGMLGFDGVNKPIFRDTNANYYELLHTGNKPSGSYTGNGDATSRTINVGGVGTLLYVSGGNGAMLFVGEHGATVKYGTSVQTLGSDAIKFVDGVLTVSTTSVWANNNGTKYEYQLL